MPNPLNEALLLMSASHADDLNIDDLDKFEDAILEAGYDGFFLTQYDPTDGGNSTEEDDSVAEQGWDSAMNKIKYRGNEGYDVYLAEVLTDTVGSPDDSDAAWICVVGEADS